MGGGRYGRDEGVATLIPLPMSVDYLQRNTLDQFIFSENRDAKKEGREIAGGGWQFLIDR